MNVPIPVRRCLTSRALQQSPSAALRRRFIALLAAGLCGLSGASELLAATYSYDRGPSGTGADWGLAENWSSDIVPGALDNAYFNISTGVTMTVNLGDNREVSQLYFNQANSAWTIGSIDDLLNSYTLTVASVKRDTASGGTQIIRTNVVLSTAVSTWDINQGFNGGLTLYGGIVGSGKRLDKWGNGLLSLAGSNTFDGGLTVNAGTLGLDFSQGSAPTSDIVFATNTLSIGGGTLTATGKGGWSVSQTFANTVLNSGNSILSIVNGNTASTRTLVNLGALTRARGATVNFIQPTGTNNTALSGTNGFTTTTQNDASGIIGGYATVGTEWAANDGTNIVAYTGYLDLAGATPNLVNAANSNVRITSGSTGDVGQTAPVTTVNTIRVNDAAARVITVGTGNTLRLGAVGGILATGTGGLTVGATGNAGTLTAGGADNTAGEIFLNNSTAVTINSTIANNGTGAVAFTKSGSGITTLTAPATHTGGTTINAGLLAFAGSSLVSGTTTNNSTTLTVSTAGLSVGQTVTGLNIATGTKIASITDGTKLVLSQATSGSGAATGNLTFYTGGTTNALNTTGDIVVNGGTFELGSTSASQATSGAVILAGGTFNNGTITKTGADFDARAGTSYASLGGTVGLVKTTAGTVTFNSANTYTGTTTILEGRLNANASGAIKGNIVVGALEGGNDASFSGGNADAVNNSSNATIYKNGSFGLANGDNMNSVTIVGGRFTSSNGYVNGSITMTGGTIVGGSNTGIYGGVGTIVSNASSETATIAGSFMGGAGTKTFTVADGAASVDLLLSGEVASGILAKAGAGYMSITGNKSYTGITNITGGTLAVSALANGGSTSSLGASSNAAASLRLGNGTTLEYTGAGNSTDRLFTVNGVAAADSATVNASGTGAATFTNTGSLAWGTTNQTRTLNLGGTNTANNTLAALIANNGTGIVSLTKQGAGKWVLSNANTYTGATTVSDGRLALDATGSINSASAVHIGAGGVFDVSAKSSYALGTGGLKIALGSGTAGFFDAGAAALTIGNALTFDFTSSIVAGSYNLIDFGSQTGDFASVSVTGTVVGSLLSAGNDTWSGNIGGYNLSFSEATGVLAVSGSAIPEPSTYALFGGAVVLGIVLYRRKRLQVA